MPPSPVTTMPSTQRLRASTSPPRPRRFRIPSAPGLIVSPHSLSRGKVARSIRRTRAPARARMMPAIAPAGPAPTMTTSHSANDQRAVLRAEAETVVAQRCLDFRRSSLVGNDVQIARRIGFALIDGRWQEATRDRERGGHDAGRAAGTLRMADHRLHRRPGEPVGLAPEQLTDTA